jgi:hypothetical protein
VPFLPFVLFLHDDNQAEANICTDFVQQLSPKPDLEPAVASENPSHIALALSILDASPTDTLLVEMQA